MVVLSDRFSHLCSGRVTVWFLVTSLTKALLAWLLCLAGGPALGRVLVVPNFHLTII